MPKSSRICCVVGCSNSYHNTDGKGIIFYSFPGRPYEKERREKWISSIRRINEDGTPWQPTKNSRVCSDHFISKKRHEHPAHPDYVPSVFPDCYKQRKADGTKRFHRLLKRKNLNSEDENTAENLPEIGTFELHIVDERSKDKCVQASYVFKSDKFVFSLERFENSVATQAEICSHTGTSNIPIQTRDAATFTDERDNEVQSDDESNVDDHLLDSEMIIIEDNVIKEEVNEEDINLQEIVMQENDDSQEPAPECSITWSPIGDDDGDIDDDLGQKDSDMSITQIFFKEAHVLQEDEEILEEVDGSSVPTCSTSEHDSATVREVVEPNSDNGNSISSLEKCTESTSTEEKVQLYNCAHCRYKTRSLACLKRHIRIHTDEKRFVCKYCDHRCSRLVHLEVHLRRHTGEKPFSCEHCDYRSASAAVLKIHLRTHSNEKPYSCEFCDYKTFWTGTLKAHLRRHTGEKPFSCGLCDYKSATSSQLQIHSRSHSGEKPYSCDFCDYKSSQIGNLKTHLRLHSGEKPFSCQFCEYKSHSPSNYRNHLRMHLDDKRFRCDFCEYKSNDTSHMKKHLRTHTGEKPFSCNSCDFKTANPSNLKNHLGRHVRDKMLQL